MATKTLSLSSIGCRLVRCGSLGENHLRRGAVIEETRQPSRFPPRFGDTLVSHDIEDGELEYLRQTPTLVFFECEAVRAWGSGFDDVQEVPQGYWVEDIEGSIPVELQGTYFRNGPGDLNFLDEPVAAPLDANGIIGSVAIKDGKAFFRSRFVKTKESLLEERAGKRLFRGVFGTIPKNGVAPFRLMQTRNAANGKPILANDKLYAPYERCAMSEVDAETLETLYPTLPDGPLSAARAGMEHLFRSIANDLLSISRSLTDMPMFLDPKIETGFGDSLYDGHRDVTIAHNYWVIPLLGQAGWKTYVKFFEIDGNLKIQSLQKYAFNRFGMLHSIAITDNYYVINLSPAKVDPTIAMDAEVGFINSIKWDYNGRNEFHLIPRNPERQTSNGLDGVHKFKLEDASCIFHFINSFEDGDDVIIDALHYPRFPYSGFGKGIERDYRMYGFPAAKWKRTVYSMNGDIKTKTMSDRMVELPSIHPAYRGRRYRYAYMNIGLCPDGLADPTSIGKVDLETGEMQMWTKGPNEAIVALGPGSYEEDDGWVVAYIYNGESKKTEFVMLDAKHLNDGPVAILYLKENIGHGAHGIWTNIYYGPIPGSYQTHEDSPFDN